MNYVEISGGSSRQRALVRNAINFAIAEMMPRFRTLDISIDILRKLDGGVFGYCWPTGERNTFQIEIKRRCSSLDEFLETIFHEMVHVKQYAKKELLETKDGTFWKGRNYTRQVNTSSKARNYDVYNKLPWEVEAYEMQDTLTEKFKKNNV